jgi:para-aminobenzoate synthetase/4-amino-4-deoxychorismate lyase
LNLPASTGLFETIAIIGGKPQKLEAHLARMQSSALALGISFDQHDAKLAIESACATLDTASTFRLRLDLTPSGELSISTGVFDQLHEPVKIFWAKDILPGNVGMFSGDALLRHKISNRRLYDLAWKTAERLGGFDALFTNEQGLLTEGGRTSIFVKPQGSPEWLTPPLSAGLLPGVMRATLLDDPKLNAREANLTINDVSMADEIILTNALRGVIKAHF